ncbi:hypothetical protein VTI74DRAFT_5586 [Chaetomium olivicolor]
MGYILPSDTDTIHPRRTAGRTQQFSHPGFPFEANLPTPWGSRTMSPSPDHLCPRPPTPHPHHPCAAHLEIEKAVYESDPFSLLHAPKSPQLSPPRNSFLLGGPVPPLERLPSPFTSVTVRRRCEDPLSHPPANSTLSTGSSSCSWIHEEPEPTAKTRFFDGAAGVLPHVAQCMDWSRSPQADAAVISRRTRGNDCGGDDNHEDDAEEPWPSLVLLKTPHSYTTTTITSHPDRTDCSPSHYRHHHHHHHHHHNGRTETGFCNWERATTTTNNGSSSSGRSSGSGSGTSYDREDSTLRAQADWQQQQHGEEDPPMDGLARATLLLRLTAENGSAAESGDHRWDGADPTSSSVQSKFECDSSAEDANCDDNWDSSSMEVEVEALGLV